MLDTFSLVYGLRKWRNEKLQLIVLVISLSFMTAIAASLVQVGDKLLSNKPNYINQSLPLITIGRKKLSGEFTKIRGFDLEELATLPQVASTTKLGIDTKALIVQGKRYTNETIGYFDSNFPSLLGIEPLFSNVTDDSSYALISHQFWQENLNGIKDLEAIRIQVAGTKKQYRIASVLPETFNKWGLFTPSLWLNASEHEYVMPFSLSESERDDPEKVAKNKLSSRTYLRGLPHYIGFATLHRNTSTESLLSQWEQVDLNELDVAEYVESEKEKWIVKGVELEPESRNEILRHWLGLTFLFVLLSALVGTNYLYIMANRLIDRLPELRMRIVLGSGRLSIIKLMLVEQIPIVLMSSMLGALLYTAFIYELSSTPLFINYLGEKAVSFSYYMWLKATILVCVFILVFALIPALGIVSKSMFSRQTGSTKNRVQKIIKHVNVFVQTTVVLISMLFITSVMIHKFKLDQSNTFNTDLGETTVVNLSAPFSLTEKTKDGHIGQFDHKEVVLSDVSFVAPKTEAPQIYLIGDERKVRVRKIAITSNYLPRFNIQALSGNPLIERDTIILNKAAADLLIADKNMLYSDLVNNNINLMSLFKTTPRRVIGIVENAPHFGLENRNIPIIYTHFANTSQFVNRIFTITYPLHMKSEVNNYIRDWNEQHLGFADVEEKASVHHQLYKLEYINHSIRQVALVMSVVILFLIATNLVYFGKTQIVLEKTKYGIMMALGIPLSSLYMYAVRANFFLFTLAIPFVIIVLGLMQDFFLQVFHLNLFSSTLFFLCVLALMLSIQLTTVYPLSKLARHPIKSALN